MDDTFSVSFQASLGQSSSLTMIRWAVDPARPGSDESVEVTVERDETGWRVRSLRRVGKAKDERGSNGGK